MGMRSHLESLPFRLHELNSVLSKPLHKERFTDDTGLSIDDKCIFLCSTKIDPDPCFWMLPPRVAIIVTAVRFWLPTNPTQMNPRTWKSVHGGVPTIRPGHPSRSRLPIVRLASFPPPFYLRHPYSVLPLIPKLANMLKSQSNSQSTGLSHEDSSQYTLDTLSHPEKHKCSPPTADRNHPPLFSFVALVV